MQCCRQELSRIEAVRGEFGSVWLLHIGLSVRTENEHVINQTIGILLVYLESSDVELGKNRITGTECRQIQSLRIFFSKELEILNCHRFRIDYGDATDGKRNNFLTLTAA